MFKTDGQGKLELDLAVLSEKIKTDEGKAEVQKSLEGIKAFSGDQYNSVLNNYKDSIKESLAKENKIESARVREKTIKEKYKLTNLEEGKDYKSTEDLVALVVAQQTELAKANGGGKASDEELQKREQRIAELTKQLETEYVPKAQFEEAINSGVKNYVDAEVSTYADKLDEANGVISNQLKFLRFTMAEEGISFGMHKGEYAAFKGGKLIEGADFKPVPVKNVIKEYADKALKVKVLAGGRGDQTNSGQVAGDADLLKLKTVEELTGYLKEKNITIGSAEQRAVTTQWQKLHKKV
jgi:hypothetical protein